MIKVTVVAIGAGSKPLMVTAGTTVENAVERAEFNTQGRVFKINGSNVPGDTVINSEVTITVVKGIEGN